MDEIYTETRTVGDLVFEVTEGSRGSYFKYGLFNRKYFGVPSLKNVQSSFRHDEDSLLK